MRKLFFVLIGILGTICCSAQKIDSIWHLITPMPHGRYCHDAVYAPNGKIYVMGGQVFKVVKGFATCNGLDGWMIDKIRNGRYSNLTYDPKTEQWEYLSIVPCCENYGNATIYYPDEDKFVDIHKKKRKLTSEEIKELCKPLSPGKRPGKLYETDFSHMGNGVAITLANAHTIFWFGGMDFMGYTNDIALPYDIGTNNWPEIKWNEIKIGYASTKTYVEVDQREMLITNIPPMQEQRHDHRAVATSAGVLYVMGGIRPSYRIVNENEKYMDESGKQIMSDTIECYDPKVGKWVYKKPMPFPRAHFSAVLARDNKIYVFGGQTWDKATDKIPTVFTVDVYDPQSDTWTRRNPMPVGLYLHAGVLGADGLIYILGGARDPGDDNPQLRNVYIYDPRTDTWERGPDMIVPRASAAAAATPDGKIYAIGGTDVGAYGNGKYDADSLPGYKSGYKGKVQDTVEVLDIKAWRASQKKN